MARNHYAKPRWPTTPAELGRAMADPTSFADLFPDAGMAGFQAFQAEYAASSPLLATLAAEQAQVLLQDQLRAGNGRTVLRGFGGPEGRPRNRIYSKYAPGVSVENVLPASDFPLSDFFRMANPRFDNLQPQRASIQNAMSERIPFEGGFLVPEVLRSDILLLALEQSVVRQRARIVQMDSLRIPYPSVDDTSHAQNVFGGVSAAWTEEGAALVQSAPAFSRVVLEALKLSFFTNIPNELLQDSGPALEQWLTAQLPAAVAWFEDLGFLVGTGVGEPEGVLNSPAAIRVPVITANTVTWDDIAKMYARILPAAVTDGIWLASPDLREQFLQLAATPAPSGGSKTPISPPLWLPGMQVVDDIPRTMFGHDIVWTEKVPSATSSNTTLPGALTFASFSHYLMSDRMAMQIAVSEQFAFDRDLTSYRIIERCTGRSWVRSALTPYNNGPTLSPFVKLDTTSTS